MVRPSWPTDGPNRTCRSPRSTRQNHVIHLGKKSVFLLEAEDRYWIENVKENLTEPGEFYVDPREQTVSLIPPAGVDPNVAQAIAPRLEQVLRLDGKPEAGQFVQHSRSAA